MRSLPRPHPFRFLLGRVASIVSGRRAWAAVGAAMIGLSIAAPDLDRMQQIARERYGAAAGESVSAWRRMLADAKAVDEQDRLARVNTFINRTTAFEDDSVVWNQPDYWATPLETLAKKAGDCEDFAIAKYVSLRLLDVPAEKLRLIYVRASIGAPGSGVSQAHMVLGYYPSPEAEPLILDNLIGDIRPAARRPDLFPVFSFNDQGLWVGGSSSSSADPTTRLSRWRSVLERMRQEGLQ
ncbi:MAG TPA: transglutaminase-like cysteine peptidase [Aromatoleum sp.]|uniref:transglutaminase-like cysteine peptidase n=1 Tax=Aromatoleum sp. TaxID=2307007 RepID=UPI002B4858E2|nr:transglutaminase-like cysteine peptidase [Aromatoleum sp.]HJV28535.1 transglutaminase-like cysteine peptidase [Aromatoleum sp.]